MARLSGLFTVLVLSAACAVTTQGIGESDPSFAVRVVDGSGQPAGGVPVALYWGRTVAPADQEEFVHYGPIVLSDHEDGFARFEDFQRLLREHPDRPMKLGLGIPSKERIEFTVDRSDLPGQAPRLVLPACGSLELRMNHCEIATASVHTAARDQWDHLRFWVNGEPWAVPLEQGKAIFPWVEIGVALEVAIESPEFSPPVRARLMGPTQPGERVSHRLLAPADRHRVVAVLVDEAQQPVRGADLQIRNLSRASNRLQSWSLRVRTDDQGMIRLTLPTVIAGERPDEAALVERIEPGSHWLVEDAFHAMLELPASLPEGEADLGTIELCPRGSDNALRRLDDASLERWFHLVRECLDDRSREYMESCLLEMARRGGDHWVGFLRQLLAARRAQLSPTPGSFSCSEWILLTSLRRAERQPDPLRVEIADEGLRDGVHDGFGPVQAILRNVDATESLSLKLRTSDARGMSGRIRAEIRDAAGVLITPLPQRFTWGRYSWFSNVELKPGESRSFVVDLADCVPRLAPGEYRLTLQYHDNEEIAHLAQVRGRIVASSASIPLKVER